jgi:hypothetical protein
MLRKEVKAFGDIGAYDYKTLLNLAFAPGRIQNKWLDCSNIL